MEKNLLKLIFIKLFCFHEHYFHRYSVTFFCKICICLCHLYQFLTVNSINSALPFNLHRAVVFSSFYIIFNQPRSRTTFVSVFVVLQFVFLFVNFFTYNCNNLLFVVLFYQPLEMFNSLQSLTSLQFQVYFVC